MPFDRLKVPGNAEYSDLSTFAPVATPITPSDSTDALDGSGQYFKYIVACDSGDVAVLGYANADDDDPVVLSLSGGQVVPGRVRRVMATGTTATVIGWSNK